MPLLQTVKFTFSICEYASSFQDIINSLSLSLSHTHRHTYTYTHIRTHTHTRTYIHTRTHTHALTYTQRRQCDADNTGRNCSNHQHQNSMHLYHWPVRMQAHETASQARRQEIMGGKCTSPVMLRIGVRSVIVTMWPATICDMVSLCSQ